MKHFRNHDMNFSFTFPVLLTPWNTHKYVTIHAKIRKMTKCHDGPFPLSSIDGVAWKLNRINGGEKMDFMVHLLLFSAWYFVHDNIHFEI